MGSTGTGHLSDYSDYKKSIYGVVGGKDTVYICDRAVATLLEDVSTSDYYNTFGNIPLKGTYIRITSNKRIVAVDNNGVVIGNLPTEYNYLLGCLQEGYNYEGQVIDSFDTPIPSVSIAITPQKKK